MCGSWGVVFTDPGESLAEGVLDGMTTLPSHRVPDVRGAFQEPGAALGHRRLSSIDISSSKHQPMEKKGCSFLMAFKGIVSSLLKLRRRRGKYTLSNAMTAWLRHFIDAPPSPAPPEQRLSPFGAGL